MRASAVSVVTASLMLAAAGSTMAAPVVINFDDLPPVNQVVPGDAYAAQGVIFYTLNSVANTVDAVGDTFAPSVAATNIWVFSNANAISGSNFGVAAGGGLFDVLVYFSTPVNSVSLVTDDTAEGAAGDVVRLMALTVAGPQFQVLAVTSGLDNATTAPGNLLSLNPGTSFQWALFQTTTEQEGFDDLTMEAVPEPTSLLLLGTGLLVGSASLRARRKVAA